MTKHENHRSSIAIIGMAGRFPKARNLDEFWRNLCDGVEGISFFTDEELAAAGVNAPESDARYVKARGLIDNAEMFDAAFFGIKPKEAEVMDPQHRIFLECAWSALEDAGYDSERFNGAIGVFAGMSMNTYFTQNVLTRPDVLGLVGDYQAMLANDKDFLPTRVSYKLNLKGPSLNIQTACSTSLVAVCVACQQLLNRQCDLALAGAASLTFPRKKGYVFQEGGIVSPDGHCRTFDAKAAGTVAGEGVGVVVLKRLDEALADGDSIYAVIKGFATNNDGSQKIGYTAPSVAGQAEVIALAQGMAGIEPESISYIEAHGTATPLGDPIEVEALTTAFGHTDTREKFCALGSVKSNIGHLDAAAGVAGLIKTALALRHGKIPPSLHFQSANPQIDFANSPFFVNAELRDWKRNGAPRRAGVSSFGIGGTNAHVVLEEAPPGIASEKTRASQLLVLSAKTETALAHAAENLARHLKAHPELNLANVAHTLQIGRREFAHRRAHVCSELGEAIAAFESPAASRVAAENPPVIFMFPGQGAQFVNMGRELYENEPSFRANVDACCDLFEPRLGFDLRTVLFPTEENSADSTTRLTQTATTQAALFTIEFALAKLWIGWGITPAAMIGHSIGEIVAACVAGVFSLEDAIALVAARGELMQAQPPGAMLAVRLPEAEVAKLLNERLSLATVNGPMRCVVSGPMDAIEELRASLTRREIACTLLQTSHAFHSPMMDAALAPFAEVVAKLNRHAPEIPFLSNVTGTWITSAQATDPAYWAQHLRQTVRFADCVAELLKNPDRVLLECGPGQTLTNLAKQHPARDAKTIVLPSLPRMKHASSETHEILSALGQLWIAGVTVDWNSFSADEQRRRVSLPTYPFERKRYFLQPPTIQRTQQVSQEEFDSEHDEVSSATHDASEPAPEPASFGNGNGNGNGHGVATATRVSVRTEKLAAELASLLGELSGMNLAEEHTASFVELGFDSLFLTQASLAIEKRMGARVAFRQLLEEFPTIEALAAHLDTVLPPQAEEIGSRVIEAVIETPESVADTDGENEDLTRFPLTEAQRELWYASQMSDAASCAYNECRLLHFHGELNTDVLCAALQCLVERHDALRTTFAPDGETQCVAAGLQLKIEIEDLSSWRETDIAARLDALQSEEASTAFNLVNGPLIRARVIRLRNDHHVLVLTAHHLVCDGHSFGILLSELAQIYSEAVQGRAAELLIAQQLGRYARAKSRRERGDERVAAEEYWLKEFSTLPPTLDLPADHPRPAVWKFDGARENRLLPARLTRELKRFSAQKNCTLFTTLLGAISTVLRKLTSQSDLVIGVPIADRNLPGAEALIGHCVNFLPLRVRVDDDQTFAEHLGALQRKFLDAHEHQEFGFGALIQRLNLQRPPDRMPLVSVTFNVERLTEDLNFAGVRTELATNAHSFANFDLSLNVTEMNGALRLDCRYNRNLFAAPTIRRWLGHCQALLEAVTNDADEPIREISILSEAERRQLLEEFNGAPTYFPRECVHHLFEEQAAQTPDAVALVFGGRQMTYRELNERANQLANFLQQYEIGPDVLIALCVERSVEMIVGVLGILKAGAAYMALDPSHPRERLELMLNEAHAPVVLTQEKFAELVTAPAVVRLDADWPIVARESRSNLFGQTTPRNLAYVSFTSGSTGKPKGVCVTHLGIVRLVRETDYVTFNRDDVFLQFAPLGFDASTFEIWGALLNGARLVIFPPHSPTLAELGRFIRKHHITTLWLTAGLFHQMVESQLEDLRGVKQLLSGGDVLSVAHVKKAFAQLRDTRIINGYGPTENTTFTCCHTITAESLERRSIPIGRPIANTQVYVLDENLQIVPVGVPGELHIGGDGLARGYLNAPELTIERFIPSPFGSEADERIYRTGDLVRWLPDGVIEFLGRSDSQVKIRGFRVEPGEVESVLSRHPTVRDCAVVAREENGEKQLVAYVLAKQDDAPSASELKDFLETRLPAYLVPNAFVFLDAFPLSANGKVDRHALPAPTHLVTQQAEPFAAPRTTTEEIIARIFRDVLGRERVGVLDNFFQLGGHSLKVTQALARIRDELRIELPMRSFFENPTVSDLAACIEGRSTEPSLPPAPVLPQSIMEIQPGGTKPPLFLVHGAGGGMFWGYTTLAKLLGADQPVYAFKSRALEGEEEFTTIEEMAANYVRDLRAFQPHGPYFLGGYCFGGNVAFEMARQLTEAGERVPFLALLNSVPRGSSYARAVASPMWLAKFAANFVYIVASHFQRMPGERRGFFAWQMSALGRRFARFLQRSKRHTRIEANDVVDLSAHPENERRIWESHIHALFGNHTAPYSGQVMLLRSRGHQFWCSFDPACGWGEFARDGVDVRIVRGAHEQILEEPYVHSLVAELKRALDAAQEPISAESQTPEVQTQDAQNRDANSLRRDFPLNQTYAEAFEKQLCENADAVAVRFKVEELTYAELNRRANRLAHRLRALGVGPETLVAVCLERSLDLLVSLLAVFKAGGAYVPLDPDYPRDRLQFMLSDSSARVLLTTANLAENFENCDTQRLCLDDATEAQRIAECSDENPSRNATAENLAYVIYTSGSTGTPKGVQISHRSMLNHNFAVRKLYQLSKTDRVLQFSTFSFDISVEEVFPTWLAGGAVVLRTDDALSSAKRFLDFVREEKLTVLNLPTAYWHELVEALAQQPLPESVRTVVIGGERASDASYKRWKQCVGERVALFNTYGPTETTVITTAYAARPDDDGTLPIGKPIANTQVFILNSQMQPVQDGETGELFIGGEGVARGYLNRDELTAQRFVPNPFTTETSARLYRTGDLARRRPDGNIEFVGREDQQVKIRGYRIELAEIESVLREHDAVKDAVVLAREDTPSQTRLVAYVVLRGDGVTTGQLREFAKSKLPQHMVPAAFVLLNALPMSPNGKVDRRALPAPNADRPELANEFVPPRTPIEEVLAKIWAEVLGINSVGVHDNFFDLGGHSLLAAQVLSRISARLRVDVSLTTLFASPTIEALAEQMTNASTPVSPMLPVSEISLRRKLPLTAAQQRLWFLDQFEPGQSPYNIPLALKLSGPLNLAALEKSLTELARRHEALRAVFPVEDGKPIQVICEPQSVPLPFSDLRDRPPAERWDAALHLMLNEARNTYVVAHPMLRPLLLQLETNEHVLLLLLHQLAADQRSIRILLRELVQLYEAFDADKESPLPPLTLAYADAASNGHLPAQQADAQLEYWIRQLNGAATTLDLPADRPRQSHKTDAGARLPIALCENLVKQLEKIAESEGATLFDVLLGGFQILLSRYTGASDILVGSTAPKRDHAEVGNLVGQFENVVVLRGDLSGEPNFHELLRRTVAAASGAWANRELPFEKLVEVLHPERDPRCHPIFQVGFQFDAEPLPEQTVAGIKFVPVEIDNHTSKLSLTLRLIRSGNAISGYVEYSTALFDADRIARMAEHYRMLLEGAAATPEQSVAKLPFLTENERRQLLVNWNATELDYPRDATLSGMFEQQVARTPDAIALVAGDECITYRELNARANRMARHLQKLGVGPEVLVGLCMERSWRMIVGILGVLKAGGAYVPMDPAYPKERLEFMLADANAPVVVTQESLRELFGANATPMNRKLVLLDSDWSEIEKLNDENVVSRARAEDLAYVIYTSGSTGKPKGVAIENRAPVSLLHWARNYFSDEEIAGVLAATSMCFDLSIFEMFVPLCWGGKVVLAQNAIALATLPAADEVTLVNTVPSAMRELLRVKGVPASVRAVNLAGEPLTTALVDQIYSETSVARVNDLYGPTETTTYSTGTLRERGEPPTIGRPLANEQVYILDAHLQPMPIGVPGELYIGGDGLARGYLNRPELTAQKFIANPFREKNSSHDTRLYKTGDLARWRADGNIEFLGRMDHQVKIRGYRIELGEIESVLRKHPKLSDVIVVAHEPQPGDKRLGTYLVPCAEQHVNADEVREFARTRLPEFMIPSDLVFLDALPLTPNGKVDRKALPAFKPSRSDEKEFVAPRSPMEQQLAEIWREVLALERVGIHDNFFELGGHSLLAIQVVSRVREALNIELPLFSLFDTPTIAELAARLESGEWAPDKNPAPPLQKVPRDEPLPASFVQERLWVIDQIEPGSHAYNVPIAVRIKGALDIAALQRAMGEIMRRHEALRTVFSFADGTLTQVITPATSLELKRVDVSGNANAENRAIEAVRAEAQLPFDLSRGPLIRAALVQLANEEHIFVVTMHHSVSDGWSLSIFFNELETLYRAFTAGQSAPALPELPVQYADFAHWQRQWMRGAVLETELAYWKETLSGAPPTVQLPSDLIAEPTTTRAAARRESQWELSTPLVAFGQRHGCTPFMVCVTALLITLFRWTHQRDQVLGTVVAGRNRREIENAIGCFMNFLPLRAKIGERATAADVLNAVRAMVLEAQAHQECPFQNIVEAVNPNRRTDQNPLYNVAFLLQNFPSQIFRCNGLKTTLVPVEMEAALLDLRFEAETTERGLSLMCEYRTSLFTAETIGELLESFRNVLDTLLRAPETAVEQFQITQALEQQAAAARARTQEEIIAISATFTAEFLAEPLSHWLKELEFPAKVEFAPYNQLFQQLLDPTSLLATNARGLNVILVRLEDWEREVGGQDKIGNGIRELIAAVKSAAARNATPKLVCICPSAKALTTEPHRAEFFRAQERILADELAAITGVYVVTADELLATYPVAEFYDAQGDALGHVPYTPAFFTALGTMIARRFNALKRPGPKVIVLDCDNTLWSGVCGEDGPEGIQLDESRRALQSFMRAQLDAGRLLCLCSKNNEADVMATFERRAEMPLKRAHFAASRINWRPKSENLRELAAELNLGLDSFVLVDDNATECAEVTANCPEVLALQLPEQPELIPQFLKHCWVFDSLKTTAEDARRTELYLQNRRREELRKESPSFADFIAALDLRVNISAMEAADVSRVAQLTQRTNQFNTTTIRRTENEVQQLRDHDEFEILTIKVTDRFGDYGLAGAAFCRAADNALDVENFLLSCRVLGKGVEHRVMAQLGAVARELGLASVNVRFAPSAKNKPALDFLECIGAQFRQSLNGGSVYAFPTEIATAIEFRPREAETQIATVPTASAPKNSTNVSRPRTNANRWRAIALEANDAERILKLIESKASRRAGSASGIEPRTPMEQQLCRIWQELLRVERIGIDDDFFQLGGHSLLAVRLFGQIHKLTGKQLPIVTIFQSPTVAGLAEAICKLDAATPTQTLLVPIQPEGTRPPLFLVHGAGGDVLWGYANLAKHLSADQPVFGVQARPGDDPERFKTLEEMAAEYVAELRAAHPHGPYSLGGYCFGGTLAYEMARQLRASGENVSDVILLEATPSGGTYESVFWWRPDFPFRFAGNLLHWWRDYREMTVEERRSLMRRKAKLFPRKIWRWIRRAKNEPTELEDVIDTAKFQSHERRLWEIHLRLLEAHRSKPYEGHVTLFRTAAHPLFSSYENDMGWSALVKNNLTVCVVPGSHGNIFLEPHVRALAEAVEKILAANSKPEHEHARELLAA